MAKKKTKGQVSIGFIAMMVCAGFLFVHNYLFYPVKNVPQTEGTREITIEKGEIPTLQTDRKEQIIYHEGYTVSYNSDYKIANWVAYELTAEEANSKQVKRSDNFIPDPTVAQNETATNEDYKQSGYDKGHLAPAGDMKWSVNAMRESFYFTNICPQNKGLNTGIWNVLENQCRKWAARHGALLIVTGPVIEDSLKQLGIHHVGIPNAFYKVICIPSGDKPKGIGFLFENKNYVKTSIRSMAVSIDRVEQMTGIDFFPSFPLEVQEEMETSSDWEYE
ncbi:MAG: DNA/RNA non-specific endonuclease [Tannerellaceae bacterium]|jgi:endonuclease G|nr:DNA/RNA non-specific endonuclease [Tannerellaceae bacterium]